MIKDLHKHFTASLEIQRRFCYNTDGKQEGGVFLSEYRENHPERVLTQQIKKTYDADRYKNATEVRQNPSSGYVRQRRSGQSAHTDTVIPSEKEQIHYDSGSDGKKRSRWWIFLLLALSVIFLLAAVLTLLPDDNPIKSGISQVFQRKPQTPVASVSEFKATAQNHLVGSKILMNMTTTTNVNNIRLVDENDEEIASNTTKMTSDSERSIWSLSVVFDREFDGMVYPMLFVGQNQWVRSDNGLHLKVTRPGSAVTDTPVAKEIPAATEQIAVSTVFTSEPETTGTPQPSSTQAPAALLASGTPPASATSTPLPVQSPESTSTGSVASAQPAVTATDPVSEGTPVPTLEPTKEPYQIENASADPARLGLKESVYSGSRTQDNYRRAESLYMQNADRYDYYGNTGVLTFRGDNYRRNAATGTVEVTDATLNLKWEFPLSSLRTSSDTLYGVGWNNQPAIVKWPKETREWMNLNEVSKDVRALREVIVNGQDGKLYFINLETGNATRETINFGYPMRGSVSVDPRLRPMIAFGQAISKMPNNKTGPIGYYVYSMLDQSQLFFLNGRGNDNQKVYSNNGAFDSSSLFVYEGGQDALIVAGENGLLYSIDLKGSFLYPSEKNPDRKLSLTITPDVIYNRCITSEEAENRTTIESAIAMYANYIFSADGYGIIRCTDVNTMKTVWAFDAGDNTDAAMALDETEDGLFLYTGNTAFSRLKKNDPVSIRKINALTGEEVWKYQILCVKNTKDEYSGCKASPVIGQNDLKDLVFFTVNRVSDSGASLVALNKDTGSMVWKFDMEESISSPVAVYNEAGNGWIIQADSKGNLYFLDGKTGYLNSTYTVENGKFEASPAVYKNLLVIGTCSREPKLYCFEIH